jgi:hypothetical protein
MVNRFFGSPDQKGGLTAQPKRQMNLGMIDLILRCQKAHGLLHSKCGELEETELVQDVVSKVSQADRVHTHTKQLRLTQVIDIHSVTLLIYSVVTIMRQITNVVKEAAKHTYKAQA